MSMNSWITYNYLVLYKILTNKIVKTKKMIQLIAQACTKMLILDLLFCEIIYVLL